MPTVIGIFGHSVETLRLVLKSIISTQPWRRDPYTLPTPWQVDQELQIERATSLSFGYMDHDGIVKPHPPIARALRIVKEALEADGHNVLFSIYESKFHDADCVPDRTLETAK